MDVRVSWPQTQGGERAGEKVTEAARASSVPTLEDYVLGDLIGRGSMGAVYEATDASGRVVALKILHPEITEHEMAVTRFEREVALARRIAHPGVPPIYDAGQLPDGRLYLAMERLVGESLEDWWDTPGRSRAEAMSLLLEALGPLAAAHRIGIVHRDLKPENVFVTVEPDEHGLRVKLLDFGIARHVSDDAKAKTATGVAVGTPVYMSPEQATKPKLAGLPTDVWSFGVMMYEALCGELPFDGDTPHAVIIAVATEPHVPLVERAPTVHADLVALVERCLLKDASRRPQDAIALERELSALLARPEVVASLGGAAATPHFELALSTRRGARTDDERAAPTMSGLRRIESPRRVWTVIAAISTSLVLAGAGIAWWSRGEAHRDDARRDEARRDEAPVDTASAPVASSLDRDATDTPSEASPAEPTPEERPREQELELGPEPELSSAARVEPRPSARPTRDVARVAVENAPEAGSDSEEGADATAVVAETARARAEVATAATTPETATPELTTPEAATPEATTPEAATPEATTSEAAPTPEVTTPTAPTKRVVRRVVRRRAPAETRPGFVTF